MPELDAVLAAQVAWLRLLRRSERTIYERQRAVIRLAAWLAGAVPACATEPPPIQLGGESGSQSDRLWPPGGTRGAHPHYPSLSDPPDGSPGPSLLQATPADLAAWRGTLMTAVEPPPPLNLTKRDILSPMVDRQINSHPTTPRRRAQALNAGHL